MTTVVTISGAKLVYSQGQKRISVSYIVELTLENSNCCLKCQLKAVSKCKESNKTKTDIVKRSNRTLSAYVVLVDTLFVFILIVSGPNDPRKVILRKMSILCEGRPDKELNLEGNG